MSNNSIGKNNSPSIIASYSESASEGRNWMALSEGGGLSLEAEVGTGVGSVRVELAKGADINFRRGGGDQLRLDPDAKLDGIEVRFSQGKDNARKPYLEIESADGDLSLAQVNQALGALQFSTDSFQRENDRSREVEISFDGIDETLSMSINVSGQNDAMELGFDSRRGKGGVEVTEADADAGSSFKLGDKFPDVTISDDDLTGYFTTVVSVQDGMLSVDGGKVHRKFSFEEQSEVREADASGKVMDGRFGYHLSEDGKTLTIQSNHKGLLEKFLEGNSKQGWGITYTAPEAGGSADDLQISITDYGFGGTEASVATKNLEIGINAVADYLESASEGRNWMALSEGGGLSLEAEVGTGVGSVRVELAKGADINFRRGGGDQLRLDPDAKLDGIEVRFSQGKDNARKPYLEIESADGDLSLAQVNQALGALQFSTDSFQRENDRSREVEISFDGIDETLSMSINVSGQNDAMELGFDSRRGKGGVEVTEADADAGSSFKLGDKFPDVTISDDDLTGYFTTVVSVQDGMLSVDGGKVHRKFSFEEQSEVREADASGKVMDGRFGYHLSEDGKTLTIQSNHKGLLEKFLEGNSKQGWGITYTAPEAGGSADDLQISITDYGFGGTEASVATKNLEIGINAVADYLESASEGRNWMALSEGGGLSLEAEVGTGVGSVRVELAKGADINFRRGGGDQLRLDPDAKLDGIEVRFSQGKDNARKPYLEIESADGDLSLAQVNQALGALQFSTDSFQRENDRSREVEISFDGIDETLSMSINVSGQNDAMELGFDSRRGKGGVEVTEADADAGSSFKLGDKFPDVTISDDDLTGYFTTVVSVQDGMLSVDGGKVHRKFSFEEQSEVREADASDKVMDGRFGYHLSEDGKTLTIQSNHKGLLEKFLEGNSKQGWGITYTAPEAGGSADDLQISITDYGFGGTEASVATKNLEIGINAVADYVESASEGAVLGSALGLDKVSADKGSADKGSADKGSADKGSADKGSADKGSADKGSADKGSADKGSADKGSADKGSADKGSADKGSADKGSADKGSADKGSADKGSADKGSADKGSADKGSADKGSADKGSADKGSADKGSADKGSADKGSADKGSADKGSADKGSADKGSADKGSADKGSADKGSADKGSADKGSADKGSADKGSADKGSADKGSADKGSADTESGQAALITEVAQNSEGGNTQSGEPVDSALQAALDLLESAPAGAGLVSEPLTSVSSPLDSLLDPISIVEPIDSSVGNLTSTPGVATEAAVESNNLVAGGLGTSGTTDEPTPVQANQAPTAQNADLGSTEEDVAFEITAASLLANSSDADGDSLSVASVQLADADQGTISVTEGGWTYSPAENFNGDNVEFTFTVSDGKSTSEASATLDVTAVNDVSVVDSVHVGLTETDVALTTSGTLEISDVDNSDPLFQEGTISGALGELSIEATGEWTFSAYSAFNNFSAGHQACENFTVRGQDGSIGSVKITINGTDDAASVTSESVALTETDVALITSGKLFAEDPDGPDNKFEPTSKTGSTGEFNIDASGNWTFNAHSALDNLSAGQQVNETFAVRSIDGTPSTVQIVIHGTNDGPEAGAVDLGAGKEDAPLLITSAKLLANSSDVDSNNLSVVNLALVTAGVGNLVANADETWTFTPAENFNGEDLEFEFTVSDGEDTASAKAVLDVTAVNDAPDAGAVNLGVTLEDVARTIEVADLLANSSDVDGDNLSISDLKLTNEASGALAENADGSWTFTPAENFNGQNIAIEFTVSDGELSDNAIAAIDVTPVNDNPELSDLDLGSVLEDGTRRFEASDFLKGASDVDGDRLTLGQVKLADPSMGTVNSRYWCGKTVYDFRPAKDFNGEDVQFEFTVSDGKSVSKGEATIDVTPVNDAPIGGRVDLGSMQEDGTLLIKAAELMKNSSDVEGDALSITGVSLAYARHGAISDNQDGTWTYTPAENFYGNNVAINFTVSDGAAAGQGTATVDVTAVNDAPTITKMDWGHVAEDGMKSMYAQDILRNAKDVDGPNLQVKSVELADASLGTVTMRIHCGRPVYDFRPAKDFNGQDVEFKVTISDGTNLVSTTATIDVTAVADTPVAGTVDLGATNEDTSFIIRDSKLLENSTDADGDKLSVVRLSLADSRAGAIEANEDGTWTFTPAQDFNSQDVSFSFTVSDGSRSANATATLDVDAINDAPVLASSQTDAPVYTAGKSADVEFTAGSEFRVNSTTAGSQKAPSITELDNGGFVVTWDGYVRNKDGSDNQGIAGQRFDANGNEVGGEFLINQSTAGYQQNVSVADLEDGGFVVTWDGYANNQDGYDGRGIAGQRFDANGNEVGGEFLINQSTAGYQQNVSVADLEDGGFVVTWDGYVRNKDGYDNQGIAGQRFDANGNEVGGEFLVNSKTSSTQYQSSVTSLEDGGFVVTWSSYDSATGDKSSYGISGQRFDANGNEVGGEFLVNSNTYSKQSQSAVTSLEDGGFVVTWTSADKATGDKSGWGVSGQRFDANGNEVGVEFLVNSNTSANQDYSSVTSLEDGGFMATWTSYDRSTGDGSGDGIAGQRFDAGGNKVGDEFLVNAQTSGSQRYSSVTTLNDGSVAVAWQSGSEIQARIFEASKLEGAAIDPTLTITDVDSPSLAGATIEIGEGFAAGDVLNFLPAPGAGIKGDFDADKGVLTLTGSATIEAYQSALRSVRFSGEGAAASEADRVIEFKVTDGQLESNVASTAVEVEFVNIGPDAKDVDLGQSAEDTTFTITAKDLLANSSDADGDKLTIQRVVLADAAVGAIVANDDETWTFTPAENFNGEDLEFEFTVSDGEDTASAKAVLDVTAVNDAPDAGAVNLGVTLEDVARTIEMADLLANSSDVDGDNLSISDLKLTNEASGALAENADGSWTFTPTDNFNGQNIAIEFTVSDGELSDQAIATLDVTPVNDAPEVAGLHLGSVLEDKARFFKNGDFLKGASDVDGDALKVGQVKLADSSVGTLTVKCVAGAYGYEFRPAKDFNGEDVKFEFTVSDGKSVSKGEATIDVTPVNDAPIGGRVDLGSMQEDGTLLIKAAELMKNSSDVEGDALSITGVSLAYARHGAISDNQDGTWTYTPAENFYGNNVAINFTVSDGAAAGQGTATVDVTAVNDAPTITKMDWGHVAEDGMKSMYAQDILRNAKDVDGPNLQVKSVELADASLGTVTMRIHCGRPVYDFRPAKDFNGQDVEFKVTISDGTNLVSTTATIDVTAVADTPVAGTVDLGATNEDTSFIIRDSKLLENSTDADGDKLSVVRLSLADSRAGAIEANEDGTWTFTPAQDFNSQDVSFSFTVSDGSRSANATATLDVDAINDAPVLASSQTDAPVYTAGKSADVEFTAGSEFRVNSTTAGSQKAPSITELDNGGFVVTWDGYVRNKDGSDNQGIAGQRFDANGNEVGGEFLINQSTAGYQQNVSVADLEDGGFVVTWDGYANNQDGYDGRGIAGQRFDANGNEVGGEFLINQSTAGYQQNVSVADLEDGGFVVTWDGYVRNKDGYDNQGIAGQRFDANGNEVGGEFLVNSKTSSTQYQSSVTSLEDGGFVVTWSSYDSATGDKSSYGISGQRFDANGNEVGGEFLVNSNTYSKQSQSAVTSLEDGGFVVTWTSADKATGDKSGWGVSGQRFDANGNEVGVEFLVNSNTSANQDYSSVTSLEDGGFMATWTSYDRSTGDGSGDGIAGQRFDAGGNKVGDEFLVNAQTSGSQRYSSVTTLNDGSVAVAWQSGSEIQARIFEASKLEGAAIDPTLTITDVDSPSLAGATIEIGEGFAAGDVLNFLPAPGAGIKGDFDADKGVLTLTGSATIEAYQSALRSVRFSGEGAAASEADRVIEFKVTDGQLESNVASTAVEVEFVNIGPDAKDVDLGQSAEDTTFTITAKDLLANSSDADGDKLTIQRVVLADAAVGAIVANDDETWTFTPAENFNGEDLEFEFTVSDGEDTASAKAVLDVTAVNDAPDAGAVNLGVTLEDVARTIEMADLLANSSDVDGDNLSISDLKLTNEASGALAENADGSWTFTPTDNFNGQNIAIEFTVSDGELSDQAIATLDVTPVNDAPEVAGLHLGSVLEDKARFFKNGDFLKGASDVDGDALKVGQVKLADSSVGTLTVKCVAGAYGYEFRPAKDFNGEDVKFEFTVSDGKSVSKGEATIDVTPVNDAPIGGRVDLGSMQEDGTLLIKAAELMKNSSDVEGDALSITGVSLAYARHGAISDNQDGTWTYTPAENFYGNNVAINFTVSDGAAAGQGTATVDVTAVNDAPTITKMDWGHVAEDGMKSMYAQDILRNAKDVDGPNLQVKSVELADASLGTVTMRIHCGRPVYDFRPAKDFNGQDVEFKVTISDGTNLVSTTATIDVTAVADTPVAGTVDLGATNEDTSFIIRDSKLLENSTDADGDKLSVVRLSLADSRAGAIEANEDGTWTFTPAQDFNSQDVSFSFTVSDGSRSANATATLDVDAINDAPVLASSQTDAPVYTAGKSADVEFTAGSEFRVNSTTYGHQKAPSITELDNGGFVIVWDGRGAGDYQGIFGQCYGSEGQRLGGEFQINASAYDRYVQDSADVTSLKDGGFVVTWDGYAAGRDGNGIAGQRFDANGNEVGGEFLVNSKKGSYQNESSVTSLEDGGFVVTWSSQDSSTGDRSGYGVSGQRFDANGNEVGGEFLVNSNTSSHQNQSSVTSLEDGGFVVTWTSADSAAGDMRGNGVSGQRFDLNGNEVGGEFLVNSNTSSHQNQSSVTSLEDGGFVVTWSSYDSGTGDRSGWGVSGQRFDANGNEVGGEFLVNSKTSSTQFQSSVTSLDDGGFVVTWSSLDSSTGDKSGWGVSGQRFDAGGNKVGDEFLVNAQTSGSQRYSSVTTLNDGSVAVAWQSGSEIQARIFEASKLEGAAIDPTLTITDVDSPSLAGATIEIGEGFAAGDVLNFLPAPGAGIKGDFDADKGVLTLTGSATIEAYQSALRSVRFSGEGAAASEADRVIEFKVTDGQLESNVASTAVEVEFVNIGPDAKDVDLGQSAEDTTFTITAKDLLANSSDADGDKLTIQRVVLADAAVGAIVANDDETWTFTPAENFNGEDLEFEFTVSDGKDTASAKAVLDVTAVNDAPDAGAVDLGMTLEDVARTIEVADLLANSSDVNGDNLSISDLKLTNEASGALAENADGSWTFTPAENFNGQNIAIEFTVSDGELSDNAIATIDVTPVNDAPEVAGLDLGSVLEDKARFFKNGDFLKGASDVDGDALKVGQVKLADSSVGTLTVKCVAGAYGYEFRPAKDFNGEDVKFEFTVSDGKSVSKGEATIDVTPVNDAPIGGRVDLGSMQEDGTLLIKAAELMKNSSDVEGDAISITGVSLAYARHGAISDNQDGTWTYTPAENFYGNNVAINFTVSDGSLSVSGVGLVDVTAVNDAPVLSTSQSEQPVVSLGEASKVAYTPGYEFRVDTYCLTNHQSPDVAALANGGFVVAWEQSVFGDDLDIAGQRFDAEGRAVGRQFSVNTGVYGQQKDPSVTSLSDGGFVVTWSSQDWSTGDSSDYGVAGQRFDANGYKLGGEFLVNSTTMSWQFQPSVTGLEDGGFVVTWSSLDSSTGGGHSLYDIAGQRFDANGKEIGGEFLVNSRTASHQWQPSVTGLVDGSFVVTWSSLDPSTGDADRYGISAQRFDSNGKEIGDEFLVNSKTASSQYEPSTTSLDDGGFVVIWSSRDWSTGDYSGYGIAGQRFDANGNAVGGEFLVNTHTDFHQTDSSVASLDDGGFVVTWSSQDSTTGDDNGYGISGQRFDSDGNKVGEEFLVNTAVTLGNQSNPSVDVLKDGSFVVGWTGVGSGTNETEVHARMFGASGAVVELGRELVDPTLTISDVDSSTLAGATISIAEGYEQGDSLTFTAFGNIQGSFDSNSGVLSLTGTVSLADYQATLRSVALECSGSKSADDRVIEFKVTDGQLESNLASTTVAVELANEAPDAQDVDLGATDEDIAKLITTADLLDNSKDADGDALAVEKLELADSSMGSLVSNGNGTWTFRPTQDWNGEDVEFKFTVSDGELSDDALATLDVTAVNDAPVARKIDLGAMVEEGQKTIDSADLLKGATDVDGDPLTITSVSLTDSNAGMLVDNHNGSWTFTAAKDYNANDVTFRYSLSDGTISDTNNAVIDILPENDAPVLNSSLTTSAVYELQSAGAQGAASCDTNLLLVLDVSGSMRASSGIGGSRLDVMKTAVSNLIDQYEASGNVAIKVVEFTSYAKIHGSEWQDGALSKAQVSSLNDGGNTNFDAAMGLVMDTAWNQSGKIIGAQNVSYFMSDGESQSTIDSGEEATWKSFLEANDIRSFALGMGNGTKPGELNKIAYDGFGESDTNSIVVTDFAQLESTLNKVAADQIQETAGAVIDNTLTIADVDNNTLQSATVEITTGFMAGDTLTFKAQGNIQGSYNDQSGVLTLTGNASLADYQATLRSVSFGGEGAKTSQADRVIEFTVNDGQLESKVSPALVEIDWSNEAPVATHVDLGSVVEDQRFTLRAAAILAATKDSDGDVLTLLSLKLLDPSLGVLRSDGKDLWHFTPASNWNGNDVQFRYTVSDGMLTDEGTASIDIVAVNDAPVVDFVDLGHILENSGARIISARELLANSSDVDGDDLQVTTVSAGRPGIGLVENIDSDHWSFTPVKDYYGKNAPITFTVSDGTTTATGTAYIDVEPVHEAPRLALVQEEKDVLLVGGASPEALVSGPVFQVNTTERGEQSEPAIAILRDGSFVVTWHGRGEGDDFGVFAQRFSVDGEAVGPEFQVNTYEHRAQGDPDIAALADGGFIISWSGHTGSVYSDVSAQRFSASGQPIDGAFIVSQATSGLQYGPSVAGLDNGGFVVTWSGQGTKDLSGVMARVFDAEGRSFKGDLSVNDLITGHQTLPTVTALKKGGFVVSWHGDTRGDDSAYGIAGKVFSSFGNSYRNEFSINTDERGFQTDAKVAALEDGGFVVVWSNGNLGSFEKVSGATPYGDSISGQRFNAYGRKVGAEFTVNSETTVSEAHEGTLKELSVTGLESGGFVVAWAGGRPGHVASSIRTQLFDAEGVKVGQETAHFVEPTSLVQGDNYHFTPGVGATQDGGYVLTWKTGIGGTYGGEIYAQVVAPETPEIAFLEGLEVAASESPVLFGATVKLSDGKAPGDLLTADMPNGLVASFESSKAVLTISGEASVATYEEALQSVRFSVGEHGAGDSRTFEIRVNDGTTLSAPLKLPLFLVDNVVEGSIAGDMLLGSNKADSLRGQSGDDTLFGGQGNDILDGGSGFNVITGGDGADHFVFRITPDHANDRVTDFSVEQGDVLDIRDLLPEGVDGTDPETLDKYLHFNRDGNGNSVMILGENMQGANHPDPYTPPVIKHTVTLEGVDLTAGDPNATDVEIIGELLSGGHLLIEH